MYATAANIARLRNIRQVIDIVLSVQKYRIDALTDLLVFLNHQILVLADRGRLRFIVLETVFIFFVLHPETLEELLWIKLLVYLEIRVPVVYGLPSRGRVLLVGLDK